jgi:PAS domain S-box-containing protein
MALIDGDSPKRLQAFLAGDSGAERRNYEVEQLCKDGSTVWVEVATTLVRNEAGGVSVVGVSRDISERKRADIVLRESEARWQFALEGAGDGVWDWNTETNKVYFSRQWKEMLGYTDEEITDNIDEWVSRVHPADKERCYADIEKHFRGDTPLYQNEHRILCKDGTYKWIFDRGKVIRWKEDGRPLRVIGTHSDITERKQTEETLQALVVRQEALLAAMPDIVMEVDRNKVYTWANQPGIEFFGGDVIGKEAVQYYEGEQGTYAAVQPLFAGDENAVYVESWQRRRDGEKRLLAWWCRVLKDGKGNVAGALSSARDITDSKRAEEALRDSLEEKVVLLKEIHHRVKNNLQIVSSLLNLQANRSQNQELIDALEDTSNRVRSMALLHETLYRTGNLARINLSGYVADLCRQILLSSGSAAERVRIENHVSGIELPLEHAVPCGLIINELTSNALKHAFPGERSGTVTVELKKVEEGKLRLSVRDDGTGLSIDMDPAGSPTLGLKLVSNLARQLGGHLTMERTDERGASMSVVFPALAATLPGGEE